VRSDPKRGEQIRGYKEFESSFRDAARSYWSSGFGRDSLSGKEANRFFLNRKGEQFADLSGLSGLGHLGDGRALGLLDYDHDGWQDLAVVNANAPKLTLYHNEIGQLLPDRRSVAIRLVGGNHTALPSSEWSNREGIGSRLHAEVAGQTVLRHVQAGEGFSAQNSNTLLIAVGKEPGIAKLEVRWPSGKNQVVGNLKAGTRVTIFEDRVHAGKSGGNSDTGTVQVPYSTSRRSAGDR
jgi:hypothetical protein